MTKKDWPPVLVVGADSTIGSALYNSLKTQGVKVLGTSRRQSSRHQKLDLMDVSTFRPAASSAGVAVLTASQTKIQFCERFPEESFRLNVLGTKSLISKLIDLGWEIIFLSSTEVFSNLTSPATTKTTANPLSTYGKQKYEIEKYIHLSTRNGKIVRLSKVIGPQTEPFAEWARKLSRGEVIEVWSGRLIAPISLDYAIEAIETLILGPRGGLWHVSGIQKWSYPQIAHHLAQRIDAPTELIVEKTQDPLDSTEAAFFDTSDDRCLTKATDDWLALDFSGT